MSTPPLHPVRPPPEPSAPAAPAPPPARPTARPSRTGDLLYLSATLLATLWALVLLFVVYPRQPIDAGYTAEDVPVVSPEGNVVAVKRWQRDEAVKSLGYLAPSDDQERLFYDLRATTEGQVKRDKLFWFLAAAAFPGVGLLLLRGWLLWSRRG